MEHVVSFQLSEADHVATVDARWLWKWLVALSLVGPAYSLAATLTLGRARWPLSASLGVWAITAALLAIGVRRSIRTAVRKGFAERVGIRGPQQWVLGPAGLAWERTGARGFLPWSAVTDAWLEEAWLRLRVGEGPAMAAPRTALPDAESVLADVRRWMAAPAPAPPSAPSPEPGAVQATYSLSESEYVALIAPPPYEDPPRLREIAGVLSVTVAGVVVAILAENPVVGLTVLLFAALFMWSRRWTPGKKARAERDVRADPRRYLVGEHRVAVGAAGMIAAFPSGAWTRLAWGLPIRWFERDGLLVVVHDETIQLVVATAGLDPAGLREMLERHGPVAAPVEPPALLPPPAETPDPFEAPRET
jgi:hypothetical protein